MSSKVSSARSKTSSASSSSGTDYTSILFAIRPPDTCTFMSEYNGILRESMDTIQQLAKVIYNLPQISADIRAGSLYQSGSLPTPRLR